MTLELFVWPSGWRLPSVDVACLAAAAQLQLALPGSFTLCECIDAHASPDGRLPYLKDDSRLISRSDITNYIIQRLESTSGEEKNNKLILSASEQSESSAFESLCYDRLGDLLNHTLFSLPRNFLEVTRPAFASPIPPPRRWIYPARLRHSHKARLEENGLWGLGGDVDVEEAKMRQERRGDNFEDIKEQSIDQKKAAKEEIRKKFDEQKIVQMAKEIIDAFSAKLGDKPYFFGSEPTLLDAIFYSHIALFLNLPFPQPVIGSLLREDYPTIINHHERLGSLLFSQSSSSSYPTTIRASTPSTSLTAFPAHLLNLVASTLARNNPILPTWRYLFDLTNSSSQKTRVSSRSNSQQDFARKRLLWGIGVTVAFSTYAFFSGLVSLTPESSNFGYSYEEADEDDELEFVAE